tara:strand:- start:241 stop:468 length:228 start_codon:yes stop_codon:yes gene_type:complete
MENNLANNYKNSDIWGNNAAFICPVCSKVFIVSLFLTNGERQCPCCGQSTAKIEAVDKDKYRASISIESLKRSHQ